MSDLMINDDKVYDIGDRLIKLREKRGLSQDQIADLIGVSRASISAYENNVSCPPSNILAKLALEYRVSADYLLDMEKLKKSRINLKNRTFTVEAELTDEEYEAIQVIISNTINEIIKLRKSQ